MYNRSTSKERFDRKIFPAENLWAKELSNMNLVKRKKNIDPDIGHLDNVNFICQSCSNFQLPDVCKNS